MGPEAHTGRTAQLPRAGWLLRDRRDAYRNIVGRIEVQIRDTHLSCRRTAISRIALSSSTVSSRIRSVVSTMQRRSNPSHECSRAHLEYASSLAIIWTTMDVESWPWSAKGTRVRTSSDSQAKSPASESTREIRVRNLSLKMFRVNNGYATQWLTTARDKFVSD